VTPHLEAWDAWPPRTVADRLAGVPFPWWVVGGWAIDEFLGEQTRAHHDLEVATPAFDRLAPHFPELEYWVAGDGVVTPYGPETSGRNFQTWAYDRTAGVWRFDVFREREDDEGRWICRRDDRIRLPYSEIVVPGPVPYLIPELTLLFKAKYAGLEKNVADFARVLPRLDTGQRARLDGWLGMIHPAHEWRARLRAGPAS
jgi:hypothetical protein